MNHDDKPPQCPLAKKRECEGFETELKGDLGNDGANLRFMLTICQRNPCPAIDPEAWAREQRFRGLR